MGLGWEVHSANDSEVGGKSLVFVCVPKGVQQFDHPWLSHGDEIGGGIAVIRARVHRQLGLAQSMQWGQMQEQSSTEEEEEEAEAYPHCSHLCAVAVPPPIGLQQGKKDFLKLHAAGSPPLMCKLTTTVAIAQHQPLSSYRNVLFRIINNYYCHMIFTK